MVFQAHWYGTPGHVVGTASLLTLGDTPSERSLDLDLDLDLLSYLLSSYLELMMALNSVGSEADIL